MSKKRLSPETIANELRGNSAFFPAPAYALPAPAVASASQAPDSTRSAEPLHEMASPFVPSSALRSGSSSDSRPPAESPHESAQSVAQTSYPPMPHLSAPVVRPHEDSPSRTPSRTSARPERVGRPRTITRYAFEFYQDQVETLRAFSLDEKSRGEKGSMSEMVREALDAYIAKRTRTEE